MIALVGMLIEYCTLSGQVFSTDYTYYQCFPRKSLLYNRTYHRMCQVQCAWIQSPYYSDVFSGVYVLLQPASVYRGLHPINDPGFRQALHALRCISRDDYLEWVLIVACRKCFCPVLSRVDKGPAMSVEFRLLLHPTGVAEGCTPICIPTFTDSVMITYENDRGSYPSLDSPVSRIWMSPTRRGSERQRTRVPLSRTLEASCSAPRSTTTFWSNL